ncbi:MAG: site-2 protease family protein [Chloroflexi bacterium]|nr:site-2 protease family protein [Chloroflexota bacterium]
MPSSIKLGKIAGIEIGVHWSWVFIFGLITWSFAGGILQEYYPDWSDTRRWGVAIIVAIIFFISILLHELSHSLVAKARGIHVEGITLFVFGGVSRLGREAESAGEEFQIAIVGPLTSLAIGGGFAILWLGLRGPAPEAAAIAGYLAFINGVIAAFNMLPGFPLDGGRVFRSIVWARNHNLLRATRIASRTGEYVAYTLMALGAAQFIAAGIEEFEFVSNPIGGIWMFIIGLFLRNASASSYEQLVLQMTLEGLTAGEIARRDFIPIPPNMMMDHLISEMMLVGRGRCYPVIAGDELLGLVTLTDAQQLGREHWPTTSVYNAMTPFEKLRTVSPQEGAAAVLQLMSEKDVNQVPVVEGNRLIGIISRADILRLIQVRRAVAVEN